MFWDGPWRKRLLRHVFQGLSGAFVTLFLLRRPLHFPVAAHRRCALRWLAPLPITPELIYGGLQSSSWINGWIDKPLPNLVHRITPSNQLQLRRG